jgi:hypothetical protein
MNRVNGERAPSPTHPAAIRTYTMLKSTWSSPEMASVQRETAVFSRFFALDERGEGDRDNFERTDITRETGMNEAERRERIRTVF